ncbi:MAG: hypothetical protein HQK60_15920 [Deltaproteobacteria bacterium]|nr:hypothetical protein [Deltaproteobacteria bacterium]
MITIHKYIFALVKSLAYTAVFMRYWLLRPWMEGDIEGWFNLDKLDIFIGFIILFMFIFWEFYQAWKNDDTFFSKLYKELAQKKDESKGKPPGPDRPKIDHPALSQLSPKMKRERPVSSDTK